MKTWGLILLLMALPIPLGAQELFSKDGNLYFRDAHSPPVQLTGTGRDPGSRLSPDGNRILFVRDTPDRTVSTGAGDVAAGELWLATVATGKAELLAQGKEDPAIEKTLAGFESPCFSPDSRFVYFMSAAWATSGSIQKLSLETKQVRFMTDGNSLAVIPSGKYQGHLLVDRAVIKFDNKGESLGRDLYLWLVSPEGKLLREIGQSEGKAASRFRKENLK
jgi:dipeptidyl aminopeptidase/acylaminoacyl peptidase